MKTSSQALFTTFAVAAAAAAQAATVYPIATNASLLQTAAGLATDGTNYLLAFTSGTNVCVQLVAGNGTLSGSAVAVGGAGAGLPPGVQVVSSRSNYLVAWSDGSIASGVDLFGQLISRTGAKLGSRFPLLQSQGGHGFQGLESLASDGTNFLVAWQDEANLTGTSTNATYGQWVTASGALSGAEFVLAQVGAALQGQGLSVAFGKTNYLAAWQSGYYGVGYDGHYATYGALISPGGTVGAPFAISQFTSPDNNFSPGAAFDGTNYLVVWNRNIGTPDSGVDNQWVHYGRLVAANGTFPGNEVLLSGVWSIIPALAFDGSNYLMAWSYNTFLPNPSIHYRFFDRSANPLGTEFTVFSSQGTNVPLAAFNGVVFDGRRFALAATLGALNTGGGDALFSSAQVYGAFLPASCAPAQVCPAAAYTNKQFSLSVAGTPGINYAIQMATNLAAPNWTALATNSPTNGPFTFTDPGATNRSRFYRAVKQ